MEPSDSPEKSSSGVDGQRLPWSQLPPVAVTTAKAFAFMVVYTLYGGAVGATMENLPARVASHFNAVGQADGWMERSQYVLFIVLLPLLLALVFCGTGALSTLFPAWAINVPNRDYWTAPEHRGEFRAVLLGSMLVLSTLNVVFVAGLHALVVAANRADPVQMPKGLLMTLGVLYAGAMVFWGMDFVSRLKRTGQ